MSNFSAMGSMSSVRIRVASRDWWASRSTTSVIRSRLGGAGSSVKLGRPSVHAERARRLAAPELARAVGCFLLFRLLTRCVRLLAMSYNPSYAAIAAEMASTRSSGSTSSSYLNTSGCVSR